MTSPLPTRLAGRFLVLILAALAAASFARGQTPVASLDPYVVSASRTAQDLNDTASSVTLLSLDALQTEQVASLKDAVAQQAGVTLYNAGAVGSQGTILIRGANAYQTLLVVDGVRMNDRSAAYQNFLGGAGLAGIDRLEVLRGPQSTLYGSSAMGGVILIDTAHGAGPAAGSVTATAGSFATHGAAANVEGATGGLGYSASLERLRTANDRPLNDFSQWSYSARLEEAFSPTLLVGATFRGQNSDYDEPGSRIYPSPGAVKFSNELTTVYGQVRVSDRLTSRLTLASHVRDYTFTDAYGVSPLHNTRGILDWQNTWEATARTEVVAGANLENSRYTVGGMPSSDRVAAGYVSAIMRPLTGVTLTGGVRTDDFKSVGSATTERAGVAWLPVAGTKLRATYGTGFSAPGSDDVYGVPSYGQLPSPGLLPEKSRGWDAGIDQDFPGEAATVSVTYFKNKFRDLFDWASVMPGDPGYDQTNPNYYQGRTINRAHASTEGAEVALVARWNARVTARLSYTYLDARDDDTGARLIRRPRQAGDAEVTVQATKVWNVGAGVHLAASRLDVGGPMGDYTTVRVFASYAIRSDLRLKLRMENALNKSYEEVYGYPALPRGLFGSVEWRF